MGELFRGLKEQGRFSDARLTADEGHRSWNETPAEDAIECRDAGGDARRAVGVDVFNADRRATRCRGLRSRLFDRVGVPRVAFRTAAEPFRRLIAAFDAGVNGRSFFRH